jgi:hypothetical protein
MLGGWAHPRSHLATNGPRGSRFAVRRSPGNRLAANRRRGSRFVVRWSLIRPPTSWSGSPAAQPACRAPGTRRWRGSQRASAVLSRLPSSPSAAFDARRYATAAPGSSSRPSCRGLQRGHRAARRSRPDPRHRALLRIRRLREPPLGSVAVGDRRGARPTDSRDRRGPQSGDTARREVASRRCSRCPGYQAAEGVPLTAPARTLLDFAGAEPAALAQAGGPTPIAPRTSASVPAAIERARSAPAASADSSASSSGRSSS